MAVGSASLSSWLYAIARSFFARQRRKIKFAPKAEASLDDEKAIAADLPDPSYPPEEAVLGKEIQCALDAERSGGSPFALLMAVLPTEHAS